MSCDWFKISRSHLWTRNSGLELLPIFTALIYSTISFSLTLTTQRNSKQKKLRMIEKWRSGCCWCCYNYPHYSAGVWWVQNLIQNYNKTMIMDFWLLKLLLSTSNNPPRSTYILTDRECSVDIVICDRLLLLQTRWDKQSLQSVPRFQLGRKKKGMFDWNLSVEIITDFSLR